MRTSSKAIKKTSKTNICTYACICAFMRASSNVIKKGSNTNICICACTYVFMRASSKVIKKTRIKFGVKFVPSKEFYPEILTNLKNNKIQAYGFLADQNPRWEKIKYWGNFMGVEVPIIVGPETIARKLDLPVFYFQTERVKSERRVL